MVAINDALFTPVEAKCYLLYRKSPGLTQAEIAAELGVNQGTVCRMLAEIEPRVETLKSLLDAAGGDSGVLDRYLMQVEVHRPKSDTRA